MARRKRAPARRRSTTRGSSRARSRTRASTGLAGIRLTLPRLPRLPALDQRERDVLGLALIALGIFMAFVLYGSGGPSTTGGRAGHGLAVALGWLLGKARVLAPVAIALGGGALLLRPGGPRPRSRSPRWR